MLSLDGSAHVLPIINEVPKRATPLVLMGMSTARESLYGDVNDWAVESNVKWMHKTMKYNFLTDAGFMLCNISIVETP